MDISLKVYYAMIKKYVWVIILFVCTSTIGMAIYSNYNYQPIYQASTKLIINNTIHDDLIGKEKIDFGSIGLNIMLINTYKEIIKTPSILEKVVQRYPDLNLTPEQIISKINVTAVNETQLMAIVATDMSQERAVKIANSVTEVFQAEVPKIMKTNNIAILNRAKEVDNPRPINQRSDKNIILAAFASLVAGIGFIIFLDSLDDTLKTTQEVNTVFDVETLAKIPNFKGGKWKHLKKRNM
ncbi:Capsular polysaccharide biosynthesis protein [Paenibacillus sp. 1_12]|uniref:YveK family protein n=1 Tax=Paenibacillus sp. 1_12 TaxID=1566278 RepID=UPI0008E5FBF9|nr:Wzz/FepE/Etk N-terminal domain-containing protein [Paenibacillus sp. 1_12]SFL15756.1 Capsular polysaccharide biosynthesis protein [Paenibacillus sp. 1_12]